MTDGMSYMPGSSSGSLADEKLSELEIRSNGFILNSCIGDAETVWYAQIVIGNGDCCRAGNDRNPRSERKRKSH